MTTAASDQAHVYGLICGLATFVIAACSLGSMDLGFWLSGDYRMLLCSPIVLSAKRTVVSFCHRFQTNLAGSWDGGVYASLSQFHWYRLP